MTIKLLEVKAGALQTAVHVLAKSVDLKQEVEENAHVAFVKRSGVEVYGTDRENFSIINLPCRAGKLKPFMVPFKELHTFVNFWDEGEIVSLTKSRGSVIISCGQDELELPLRQGAVEFVRKFPKPPAKGASQVVQLPYALSIATPIVDTTTSADFLHGPHIKVSNGVLKVEGASEVRLVRLKTKTPSKESLDCVILKEGGELFSRLASPGRLVSDRTHLYYTCQYGTFATLIIQGSGRFPDFDATGHTKPTKGQALFQKSKFNRLLQKVGGVGSDRFELRGLNVVAGALPQYRGRLPANKVKGAIPLIALDADHMRYLLNFLPKDMFVLWFGGYKDSVWYQDQKDGVAYTYVSSPYVVRQDGT